MHWEHPSRRRSRAEFICYVGFVFLLRAILGRARFDEGAISRRGLAVPVHPMAPRHQQPLRLTHPGQCADVGRRRAEGIGDLNEHQES